jgi:hypothetical protein
MRQPQRVTARFDFGGLGWVHMVQHSGALCQLDLYLIPDSKVPAIPDRIRRQVIYTATAAADDAMARKRAALHVARGRAAAPGTAELVTETVILASMIRKRLTRSQQFMAYKEAHQMITAVRALIRTALFPDTAYLEWYHLEEMIGVTPIGRSCLLLLGVSCNPSRRRTRDDCPAKPNRRPPVVGHRSRRRAGRHH